MRQYMTGLCVGISVVLAGCASKPLDLSVVPIQEPPIRSLYECAVRIDVDNDVLDYSCSLWAAGARTYYHFGNRFEEYANTVGTRLFSNSRLLEKANDPAEECAILRLKGVTVFREGSKSSGMPWDKLEDRIAAEWEFVDPHGSVLLEKRIDAAYRGAIGSYGLLFQMLGDSPRAKALTRMTGALQDLYATSVNVLRETPEIYRYDLLVDLYTVDEDRAEETAEELLRNRDRRNRADLLNAMVYFSIERNMPSLYSFCRSHGAEADTFGLHERRKPIHVAAYNGRVDILSDLAQMPSELEVACKEGHTPLFYALLNDHLKAVDVLVAEGATSMVRYPDNSVVEGDLNYHLGDHLLSAGMGSEASTAFGVAQDAYERSVVEMEDRLNGSCQVE